jgi:hypothetical protein
LTSNSLDEVASAAVFRSNPSIERVPLANGESCYVVDDALHEPERFVEWAAARREEFRAVDFNAYPGTYRMMPAAI